MEKVIDALYAVFIVAVFVIGTAFVFSFSGVAVAAQQYELPVIQESHAHPVRVGFMESIFEGK